MSEPTSGLVAGPSSGRASGSTQGPASGSRTHRLRVIEVIAETADAHSLVLQPPPEAADRFTYRPGQFLTLKLPGASLAKGRSRLALTTNDGCTRSR
ncbi:hypothetical protein ABZY09_44340 [Streptomyces sp. NPDC002928]|uniref:hypothetical protein n=1 Tax=Streptomyces sp. NPDC002928 TaxID=3154440 RepID=UPI0033AD92EE